jgi:hypothetical protein
MKKYMKSGETNLKSSKPREKANTRNWIVKRKGKRRK